MTKATIRQAVAGDGERLSLIGRASFLASYAGLIDGEDLIAYCARSHGKTVYEAWLSSATAMVWLAESDPNPAPVGYLVMDVDEPTVKLEPGDIEIKRVYILPRFQRLSLGRRLIEHAEQAARERGFERLVLGVFGINQDAISFYASTGFKKIGLRKFRVGRTDYDDLVMAKDL